MIVLIFSLSHALMKVDYIAAAAYHWHLRTLLVVWHGGLERQYECTLGKPRVFLIDSFIYPLPLPSPYSHMMLLYNYCLKLFIYFY